MPHVWPVRTGLMWCIFSDIVAAKVRLSEYQFLVFPGGFLDGDDLGAAQAAAQRWLHLSDAEGQPLAGQLEPVRRCGRPRAGNLQRIPAARQARRTPRVGREAF